ncbi:MAG: excinuclease ABC subunit UvrB [Nanoarchaeota archaeon]|nr:excinuclease ABC subunit UvrB [Nanoarchaeota archaeon]
METQNFKIVSEHKPAGSQPEAIRELTEGIKKGKKIQTLLGVTGSGKTFTIANVIEKVQMPTLVIAHNKTLAAQLYEELKTLFPKNKVEYFVSYYDYYQPESYLPTTDQYIEKDAAINAKLDQMRLAATSSVLGRKDTIVVASVSCIYGLGNPKNYLGFRFSLEKGMEIKRRDLLLKFIDSQYKRNDTQISPGVFRVKGDTIDFIPSGYENIIRIELFEDKIATLTELDRMTGKRVEMWDHFTVYPAKHFVISSEEFEEVKDSILEQLKKDLPKLEPLESHRLNQRTRYDLEMIKETGYCKGIENYSRHFDKRSEGEKPYCLLDYFSGKFLIVIDESHQTIPQLHGMFKGDRARKKNLIDYGFRLTSAYDNRPLKFEEFEEYIKKNKTIFVSATPGFYEHSNSKGIVEQIIRPTGLLDPEVEVRPAKSQVLDVTREIGSAIKRGNRVLVTTLTKKLAEELSEYLSENNIKTRYLHSEIDTLERTEIIRELRLGKFDVLVGINLLREGLDIPEVGFVGILDADKEGFLRNDKSLIQTIGRAARNLDSKVILYADVLTDSIKTALSETRRRREIQEKFNKENNITPKTIVKPVKEKEVDLTDTKHIPKKEIPNLIIELESQMKELAEKLEFEDAIRIKNRIENLTKRLKG